MVKCTFKHFLLAPLLILLVSCSTPQLTQQDKFLAYDNALKKTEMTAEGNLQAQPDFVAAAIERLRNYYDDVTIESVRRLTQTVYARESFLCDTLHVAQGAREIEEYFVITAERVNSMQVNILDYSASGKEIYARWTMTISADELADGKPVTTYGVSHFRLDPQGMVVLHQDFWDASAGFFELLPGLEEVIQRLRGNL